MNIRHTSVCLLLLSPVLKAAPFTAGNIAVFQADASANNTTAAIVELDTAIAAQMPSNSIVIDGTGANAMRFSGSATSTGYLATTNDGSLLTFVGANNTTTGSNVNTLNPRGVGVLNPAGTFSLPTTYTGTSGNQTRSATSLDNSTWWIADQGGLYTNSTTAPSPTGNFRGAKAFGGAVYLGQSSSTSTLIQVSTISAATGGTLTGLPGLTNLSTMQDFHLISSGGNGSAFDVLYVIGATSNTAGTVYKYSLVTGSWVANGTYTTTFGGFGLAAKKSGAGAELFISTGQGALVANNVLRLTDTAGHNATLAINTANNVTLYTAPSGKIVKGVAFAPATPPPVVLAVSALPSSFSETAANPASTGTVTRNPVSASNLVVNLASSDATEATVPATVTILANQASANFDITAQDDPDSDGDQTVTLTASASGVTSGMFNVTVQDNEPPPAQISIADASVLEGNSGTTTLNLVVSRTNALGAFTVNFATSNGTATAVTDYAATSGTLTFTAGGDLTQSIPITINGDTEVEANETINVTLSSIVNSLGTATFSDATGVGTITNDDSVPVLYPPNNSLTSTVKGSINLAGAEIPAFDPLSDRAFAGSGSGVQVVNLANPAAPAFITTLVPSTLGIPGLNNNDISSVAVRKGSGSNPSVLAVAIITSPKTNPGFVVFFNAADNSVLGHVSIGANPDHIAWTPDGTKLLVCNEGELDGTAATIPDPAMGTVSIIAVNAAGVPGAVQTADFTAYDAPATITALRNAGVRIFGPNAVPSTDFEPEYLAISPDGATAMVTLQEANAIAVLDIATATFTSVLPLGKKDFSTLRADFSDQDGVKNPKTGQPVFGLYMPDAIASFSTGGQTYYISANEGDDRDDFLTPDETIRVGSGSYTLDPTVFPNAATLKQNANLGRLVVSNFPGLRGDTDGDGDIDEILTYGGRGFSIYNSAGTRIYDSGDMVEMIVASLHNNKLDDTRSDNKGPEPEGVTVAKLGARTFAFLGLERSHMTLVFDVTNPLAPTYVTSLLREGDLNPEGLIVVSEADSPSGRPLLIVASEVSNTLTVFELTPATDYTLQLLHLADAEAGLLASQTAPNLAALVDAYDGTHPNTVILAGGDNFIPGPFLNGGTDPTVRGALNTATGSTISLAAGTNHPVAAIDIAIHNVIGVEASTIGNHELDLGSRVFRDAFTPASVTGWVGANFPYMSANLDFSGDADLNPRFTAVSINGTTTLVPDASTVKGRIVPTAVLTKGGQKIGLVAATTQLIEGISSPTGTEVLGFPTGPGPNGEFDNIPLLASQLQPYINELIAEGVNKIIVMSHLQQIANEQALAPLLTGVDIILAAGSNTRLGDSDDVAVAFTGHAANFAANYPIHTAGADGQPTVIVNTDNEFTYLGRLVANFDADGVLIVPNLLANTAVNGAYAATDANVAAAWGTTIGNLSATAFAPGTKGALVKSLTDAVQGVINTKDGDIRGYTDVYLEGERNFVRNEETNLGDITADSMVFVGETALPSATHVVALKNGGGIRAAIGAVEVGSGNKIPPQANPAAGKPAGAVSLLDIENSLRFNNGLMLCDTTPAGLKAIIEHGVALLGNQGRFPQIGGVRFFFDPAAASGSRVQSIVLVDENDNITARVISGGSVHAAAPATITLVTLNFLAQGGDGYPFKANADNFRFLLTDGTLSGNIDESLNFTAAGVVPANILGEQLALSNYLQDRYATPATAFDIAETVPALDTRIQNQSFRSDSVSQGPVTFLVWQGDNNLTGPGTGDSDSDGLVDLMEFAFGLNPNANDNTANVTDVINGVLASRGTPAIYSAATGGGRDFRVVFIRRRNAESIGVTYIPRFSSDLNDWQVSNAVPTVIATSGDYEAVSIRYPFFVNGRKAQFFQVGVSQN
jgi:2',3'-cyclic-nucleotide 2'-phosphodiesterase (5'-nucleotidase family)